MALLFSRSKKSLKFSLALINTVRPVHVFQGSRAISGGDEGDFTSRAKNRFTTAHEMTGSNLAPSGSQTRTPGNNEISYSKECVVFASDRVALLL